MLYQSAPSPSNKLPLLRRRLKVGEAEQSWSGPNELYTGRTFVFEKVALAPILPVMFEPGVIHGLYDVLASGAKSSRVFGSWFLRSASLISLASALRAACSARSGITECQ